MTEEFLQYIWKYALLDRLALKTADGKVIQIVRSGLHNSDAGPDFLMPNCKLEIPCGQEMWNYMLNLPIGSGINTKMIRLTKMLSCMLFGSMIKKSLCRGNFICLHWN